MPTTDEERESVYAAVWDSGVLTGDAWVNVRIWRAVETALDARAEWERNRPISNDQIENVARTLRHGFYPELDGRGVANTAWWDRARAALRSAREAER